MKKINFLFGALAALAMGGAVTACSDDDLDKGIDNGKVEYDQTRYLSVTVCSPNEGNGSRADNEEIPTDNPQFNTGEGDENYIHELYFVFYDANKAYLDHHHITFTNNDATNNGSGGTIGDSDNPSINKVWTSTIPVNLTTGQNMPSYVMAFVNPLTPADLIGTSIPEIEKITRQSVQDPDDDHFPMSNSVYYGNNPITGEANVRMVATPITTAQLYKDAAEAAKNPAVEIYVERYAAKINLTMAANAIAANANQMDEANTPAVNDYTLKFVPEYWRPNGIDKNMYVLKHYAISNNSTINSDPTITELNDRLKWTWNAPTNFRSYWGCSPSYYNATYPKVSDDIQDGGNTYTLHYFSYNEIINPEDVPNASFTSSKAVNADGSFSGAFYSRETTASSSYWQRATDYNPVAVVAGAVIVGRYELTDKGGTSLAKNTTFWLYGKTNGKWNLYDTKEKILDAMAKQQSIVLDKNTKQPIRITTPFTVEHPAKAVRTEAEAVVAGRFVALQVKATRDENGNVTAGSVPTGYCFYDPTQAEGARYVDITADNVNEVNAALLTAGYARQYGSGLCYFNIPIQHLGFNTADYVTPEGSNEAVFSWNTARAGSFGLVRNHVYTINIKSINGLATALRDEDQPIVPPMDEQTYYISAKLNVLNWRIVPTQNVIL